MDLKGKVVVITSGTKGLEKALAEIFQRKGSLVIVGGRETTSSANISTPKLPKEKASLNCQPPLNILRS